MKKIIAITILTALLFSGIASVQARPDQSGKTDDNQGEYTLPEEDGTYDVPGHPKLKLRVFVHKIRGSKPTPTPTPASTPVCGLSDNDSSEPVAAAGWHLPANWTYTLNPSSVPASVGSANLNTIAERAFKVWSDSSGVIITPTSGTTVATRASRDGQNIITWGRTSGSALGITYTWYMPDTKEVLENDTIMNIKFPWSWADQTALPNCAYTASYDAQDILTHEIGHWMGLSDHYTDAYADHTMYGYGFKKEVEKDTLTTGDISGINNIYSPL